MVFGGLAGPQNLATAACLVPFLLLAALWLRGTLAAICLPLILPAKQHPWSDLSFSETMV